MKKILTFMIIFLTISCNSNNKYKIFVNYLNNNFDIIINNDAFLFILIPEYSCKGCISDILSQLNNINTSKFNQAYIITSKKSVLKLSLSKNFKILYDSNGILDKLDLDLGNITIININNNKIRKFKNININNNESLDNIINN